MLWKNFIQPPIDDWINKSRWGVGDPCTNNWVGVGCIGGDAPMGLHYSNADVSVVSFWVFFKIFYKWFSLFDYTDI